MGGVSDGTRIVTASRDKTAREWEAQTGKLLAELGGHGDKASTATSPDGRHRDRCATARGVEAQTGKLRSAQGPWGQRQDRDV